jgi:hypothetical protein
MYFFKKYYVICSVNFPRHDAKAGQSVYKIKSIGRIFHFSLQNNFPTETSQKVLWMEQRQRLYRFFWKN